MSSSSQNTPDQLKMDCYCGVRSPLRTAPTDENVERKFLGCVNYHKDQMKSVSFSNGLILKRVQGERSLAGGLSRRTWICRTSWQTWGRRWRSVRGVRSEEWLAVKVSSMKNEMNEMEDGFRLKMEEWQKREAWYAVKMEEVEAKNVDLRKKNKVLKEKVESEKWKGNVLSAMVLAIVAIVVMFFCDEGMWKRKMLALP